MAPWAGAITGRPIACASIIVRPAEGGSVAAETTTAASFRAAGISSDLPATRTTPPRPDFRALSSSAEMYFGSPSPTMRQRNASSSCVAFSSDTAFSSTSWPFEASSRPGARTMGRVSSVRPHSSASWIVRAGPTTSSAKTFMSAPLGITVIRSRGSVLLATALARVSETAITRLPDASALPLASSPPP